VNAVQQPLPAVRVALSLLVMVAFGLAAYRFYGGLGAATNLSDSMPWGLWIGLDMLCGIALAAGGFVLAGTVHIFGLKRYEAFVRPAITTALLGYLLAVIGLIMDLGRPWAIWHPLIMWQPHSVMFEVAWCVMLYTTVLFLEFLPIVFEKFRMVRALRLMRRVMIVFILLGIILSTVHQSSLGSLFVMMGHKLHPLWFTPLLPLLFLMSSLAVGVAMVIFEAILSGMIFGHRYPTRLLGDLARALPLILSLYVGLRLMDLNARGVLERVLDNTLESWAFLFEMILGVLLPGVLLLSPEVRYDRLKLFGCTVMVILGVVMNRLNVCLLGMLAASSGYMPRWIEILVSAGVIAGGLLVLSVMNRSLPIVEPAEEGSEARAAVVGKPHARGAV
jgi:Ni/Fe-hydrogenase subunit HybB-like protein